MGKIKRELEKWMLFMSWNWFSNRKIVITRYKNAVNEMLTKGLRELRGIHSMNVGFVSNGTVFQVQLEAVSYICGTKPQGNRGYFPKLEEIVFCKDCNGKLTRLYNDGKYSLGQKGNYYKCVKCAKMYSQETVEKIKNSKIFK